MNGNILVFKKFIVLTQRGTFKILPARYYKPICVDESAEAKTSDKTIKQRLPEVVLDAAES